MARDYKYRTQERRTIPRRTRAGRGESQVGFWKWMAITALLIAFAVFLAYLGTRSGSPALDNLKQQLPWLNKPTQDANEPPKAPESPPEPAKPRFDFYTILPKNELVVDDHEIKTRAREERAGKGKESKYTLQAGSFKNAKEADQLRAKLALMGIESRIDKTTVGNVTWSRVKLGPFSRMSSVNDIRTRLRQNGIDVVVIEQNAKQGGVQR